MKLTRVEYQIEQNIPVIYLFERDGMRTVTKIRDFKPYLYIPADETDLINGYPGACLE